MTLTLLIYINCTYQYISRYMYIYSADKSSAAICTWNIKIKQLIAVYLSKQSQWGHMRVVYNRNSAFWFFLNINYHARIKRGGWPGVLTPPSWKIQISVNLHSKIIENTSRIPLETEISLASPPEKKNSGSVHVYTCICKTNTRTHTPF